MTKAYTHKNEYTQVKPDFLELHSTRQDIDVQGENDWNSIRGTNLSAATGPVIERRPASDQILSG